MVVIFNLQSQKKANKISHFSNSTSTLLIPSNTRKAKNAFQNDYSVDLIMQACQRKKASHTIVMAQTFSYICHHCFIFKLEQTTFFYYYYFLEKTRLDISYETSARQINEVLFSLKKKKKKKNQNVIYQSQDWL